MRLGITPGARCGKITLGFEEKDRVRIGYLEVDVARALHVASYADFIHEACHLVVDEVIKSPRLKERLLAECAPADYRLESERLEDVFALMLSKIFVFGDDTKAFCFNNVLGFSRDSESVSMSDRETCQQFTDVVIRLYFATEGMDAFKGDPTTWQEPSAWDRNSGENVIRFKKLFQEVGPFFSEYDRIWNGPLGEAAWEDSLGYFGEISVRLGGMIPIVRKAALDIYGRFIAATLPGLPNQVAGDLIAEIAEKLRRNLSSGTPLVWSDLTSGTQIQDQAHAQRNLSGDTIDPLIVICQVLKAYIEKVKRGEGMEVHLRRDSSDGQVEFPKVGREWWRFQADKGAAALFCCVPELRMERLRQQVAAIKTFWDVSSELRARRFLEMLAFDRPTPSGAPKS